MEMWKDGDVISFEAKVKARNVTVIKSGRTVLGLASFRARASANPRSALQTGSGIWNHGGRGAPEGAAPE